MKEILGKKLALYPSSEGKFNALREGLQHLILKILDDRGYFKHLAFIGGTALRVLYDLRRFSEDMDFSLQKPNDPHFDFQGMVQVLQKDLEAYGLPTDAKTKSRGAVQGVFFGFRDILQDLHVSQREGQKLHVKLEADKNPPQDAKFEAKMLQKDFLFTVVHHDLPTLFAGKMLAVLFRSYTKGRDIYDLIWYCTRKVSLNRPFFYNGLFQATGKRLSWTEEELSLQLRQKIESLSMEEVTRDALPFLDDPKETRLFEKDLLLKTIEGVRFV